MNVVECVVLERQRLQSTDCSVCEGGQTTKHSQVAVYPLNSLCDRWLNVIQVKLHVYYVKPYLSPQSAKATA